MNTEQNMQVTGTLTGPLEIGRGLSLASFPRPAIAVVLGAGGGIGGALVEALRSSDHFQQVIGFGRDTAPAIDLLDETSLEGAASFASSQGDVRLIVDATGFLHSEAQVPEKSWRQLDPVWLAKAFAINAVGPALIMKHFLPRLPRSGKAVFATLSARVGSISDNRLGGWYSYRASKAALNQLVRTAAVELARKSPDAICIALHPGTVATALSSPFAASGLDVQTPDQSAANLLAVLEQLTSDNTGGFYDWLGQTVPW
jgi:NAD(P)-dependent dehydrogenase (short-subunit alcohol dehydrogenase family)